MMKYRYWAYIITAGIISGCSFTPKDNSPTLKSLEERPIEIDTSPQKNKVVAPSASKAKENYEAILKATTDNELRRRAMRRLADLELIDSPEPIEDEAAKRAQEEQSAQLQAGPDLNKAIKLYEGLLQSFPNKEDNDRIYYQLARAYEETGDIEKSLEVLTTLVEKYPETIYHDEAQFRRGEIFFVFQEFDNSEQAYTKSLTLGKSSPYYERATYKLGWSLYKQERYNDAVTQFLALVDRKLGSNRLSDNIDDFGFLTRGDIELVKDLFRVLSLSFSALDGPSSIQPFFADGASKNYEYLMYRSLGDFYLKQERYLEAGEAYRYFSSIRPEHPQGLLLIIDAIELYQSRGLADLVLNTKIEIANRYGQYLVHWAGNEHHGFNEYLIRSDKKLERRITNYIRLTIEELGRYYHAKGQKNKNSQDYMQAIKWYQTFVHTFLQDPKTPEINFLLAEVLYEETRYGEAIREYEKTAYNYTRHKLGAEAGYAALVAYEKYKEFLEDQDYEFWHNLSMQSSQRFAKLYPRDPRTPAVLGKVIDHELEKKQYAQAIAFSKRLLSLGPNVKPELLQKAALTIATAHFEEGNFVSAEEAYAELMKTTPKSDKNRKGIEDRLAASIYKQGEAFKEQGDLENATRHFMRLGAILPHSDFRPTAEFDAAANMITAKNWQRAISILEGFKRNFPNHEFIPDVNDNLAVAYLETKNYVQAANQLTIVSETYADPAMKRDAIWQTAELYEQGNASDKAIDAYKTYIRRYPSDIEQTVEARQRIIDLYGKRNLAERQNFWRKELIATIPASGTGYSDRTRFLAASAALILAQPTYTQFNNIELVAPLKQNIANKRKAMETALKAFNLAGEYGIAQITTESTFKVGELYRVFSSELLDSERPEGLSDEALEQYELVLEDQAYPLEEKAIEIHETNAVRISDNLYDDWIKGSFKSLGMLLPARYGKYEHSTQVVHEIY